MAHGINQPVRAQGPLSQRDRERIAEDIRAGRLTVPAQVASAWGIPNAEARHFLDQFMPRYRARAL